MEVATRKALSVAHKASEAIGQHARCIGWFGAALRRAGLAVS